MALSRSSSSPKELDLVTRYGHQRVYNEIQAYGEPGDVTVEDILNNAPMDLAKVYLRGAPSVDEGRAHVRGMIVAYLSDADVTEANRLSRLMKEPIAEEAYGALVERLFDFDAEVPDTDPTERFIMGLGLMRDKVSTKNRPELLMKIRPFARRELLSGNVEHQQAVVAYNKTFETEKNTPEEYANLMKDIMAVAAGGRCTMEIVSNFYALHKTHQDLFQQLPTELKKEISKSLADGMMAYAAVRMAEDPRYIFDLYKFAEDQEGMRKVAELLYDKGVSCLTRNLEGKAQEYFVLAEEYYTEAGILLSPGRYKAMANLLMPRNTLEARTRIPLQIFWLNKLNDNVGKQNALVSFGYTMLGLQFGDRKERQSWANMFFKAAGVEMPKEVYALASQPPKPPREQLQAPATPELLEQAASERIRAGKILDAVDLYVRAANMK